MSDVAIQVEGVSKLYHIGKSRTYKTARETVMNALKLPARLLGRREEDHSTDLWALRDVNFSVNRGEVIGIIGRNGAGKSTLLKVLSRITEPTSGKITLKGRVGSLLEVGTGFHPELTGRENIFLNGAILGMRRAEIQRNFDAIVAFSEVEKFIDTPVKHYSSGMYTRLAFAVAAHLEPQILIVDEVLAVGDAAFQKKCLGKMRDVAGGGRTVLFVSHNLAAIASIAAKGLVLHQGRLHAAGPIDAAVKAYLDLTANAHYSGDKQSDITARFSLTDEQGNQLTTWSRNQKALLNVSFERDKPLSDAILDFAIYTEGGVRIFSYQGDRSPLPIHPAANGTLKAVFELQNPGIASNEITFDFGLRETGSPKHIALWTSVLQTAIGLEESQRHSFVDAVLALPCRLREAT